jgi:hypothetical protein
MRIIKEFRVAIIFFLLLAIAGLLVQKNKKDYETGYVTTGNPDNSYLDSTRVYCCGD